VADSVLISPNKYQGHDARTWIVIHTMEAPEADRTAENVAHYFANPAVQASAHWCTDDDSSVRCVRDDDSAWTIAHRDGNRISLNIELAGYAQQTAGQWDDKYSDAELSIAAHHCAEWAHKYNIPVRHLDHAQIRTQSEKGFLGHADVNAVFGWSTHTDPGPHFPWDRFLRMVKERLDIIEHTSKPPHDTPKPDCTRLQRAVRATDDNKWGSNTDKHCEALISATDFGGNEFPFGVEFAQKVVGTAPDGQWGPKSKKAMHFTLKGVQIALSSMGFNAGKADGTWDVVSNKAYEAARKACHI
jgi:N-acetyl-anhydromuramyl-L-alanine amidase AmpD